MVKFNYIFGLKIAVMEQNESKVIWVTGASSGIGEAVALEYNKRGFRLIISSRKADKLATVKAKCHHPDRVHILLLDLADYQAMPLKVNAALEVYGRIDILINNAGISQRSLISETQIVVDKRMIEINYLGTVALSKALLPYFIRQKKGHYVTVTSLMGKFGSPYRSSYCGAKHALHGFFDVLRMEHQKDGIEVTLICPGFVQTDVARNALTADGSPQGSTDAGTENGMPPDLFAKKMIRAINKKKFEAYIGGKEVKGIYLKRFLPKLLHKVVLRSQVV